MCTCIVNVRAAIESYTQIYYAALRYDVTHNMFRGSLPHSFLGCLKELCVEGLFSYILMIGKYHGEYKYIVFVSLYGCADKTLYGIQIKYGK